MARQFLAIPEASTTAERVFSATAERVFKSLLEGTLEAIMWVKWGLPVFLWVEVIFT
jgi:hypothetical protein